MNSWSIKTMPTCNCATHIHWNIGTQCMSEILLLNPLTQIFVKEASNIWDYFYRSFPEVRKGELHFIYKKISSPYHGTQKTSNKRKGGKQRRKDMKIKSRLMWQLRFPVSWTVFYPVYLNSCLPEKGIIHQK